MSRPTSAAKPSQNTKKNGNREGDDDQDGGSVIHKMEGLEPSDAIIFPLMAGLTLGGLYWVIKWLEDPAILNKILGYYFSQMGILFSMGFLKDAFSIIRSFIFPSRYHYQGKTWNIDQEQHTFVSYGDDHCPNQQERLTRASPFPWVFGSIPLPMKLNNTLWLCRDFAYRKAILKAYVQGMFEIKQAIGLLDILSTILALVSVSYFGFVSKPWWLTNFFGFSFSYGALQFMSPSTFWTGTLILGSLFFYDIYFVFYTPLMVTVATKLDVPIKLLIPRPSGLAMLGLGDIVIPGMMVGLALRYDLYLYYARKSVRKATLTGVKGDVKAEYQSPRGGWGERFWGGYRVSSREENDTKVEPPYPDARSFPKTYFYASLFGYIIGMIATLAVMQYWDHAQPALLYLVPSVLVSLWGTALVRGDIGTMWKFSDSFDEAVEESSPQDGKKHDNDKANMKKDHRGLFARIWTGDITFFYNSSLRGDKKEEKQPRLRREDEEDTNTSENSLSEGEKQEEDYKEVVSSTENTKSEQRHQKKHSVHEWLSFSISIPPSSSESGATKVKVHEDGSPSTQTDTDVDNRIDSLRPEFSDVGSPSVERDDEPVLKKRRSG